MTAAERWRTGLADWAIPTEIFDVAPEPPWGFRTDVFVARTREAISRPQTATHRRITEVLPAGGSLLDVGAGAGASSLPAASTASRLVAVDESRAMLDGMVALAADAAPGADVVVVEGRWPDVAEMTGSADVVVCGNVAYNVADLAPFLTALTRAARGRVVLELTAVHPQTPLSPLWQHFWDLQRPSTPTADDALDVIRESVGCVVHAERWVQPPLMGADPAWLRRRLCLGPEADHEITRLLGETPFQDVEMMTAWWPGSADRRADSINSGGNYDG